MGYLIRNLVGISLILISAITGNLDGLQELSQAERIENWHTIYPDYERGNCDSLEELFRWHGMTDEESRFFFDDNILWRESRCGLDTYNERTGDTGVCQLTHFHSKPGYFFGRYYEQGWALKLFNLQVGKTHGGVQRDHPNIVPACLWLLRGGSYEPGTINRQPWKASW